MNLQNRNLTLETHGDDVRLLHTELRQLGFNIRARETQGGVFGESTYQAVIDFQRTRGLRPNGVVDSSTAAAINVAVEARQPIPELFALSGEVHHEDGSLLAGLTVKAFDQGPRGEDPAWRASEDG